MKTKMSRSIILTSLMLLMLSGLWGLLINESQAQSPAYPQTYYVSPQGSDVTGTGREGSPWRTITRAWQAADSSQDSVIYIAPGNYYTEVRKTTGGPDTGVTWTFQFAGGQTNVRIADEKSSYLFRPSPGRSGRTVFKGGSTGAIKTTRFDLGTYGDGNPVSVAGSTVAYPNESGQTFDFRDIEFSGEGAEANSCTLGAASNGTLIFRRCYIHNLKRIFTPGSNSNTGIYGCYFYNAPYICFGTGSGYFYFYNNTINHIGYAATNPLRSTYGIKDGPVRIMNNLFVSDMAATTLLYFVSIGDGTVVNDIKISSNIAWKTAPLSAPRTVNNYIAIYDSNGEVINNVIAIDPSWTGSSTSPSVGSTSMTIGRGAHVGIATDFANVPYPSDSIGCYAVPGGTKQYLTTSNKVLTVGDSWVYQSPPTNKFMALVEADPDLSAFTFVRMPGSTSFPGISGGKFNRYRGMALELAQANAPGVIVIEGGVNDMNDYSGAGIGLMHNALADDLSDLYAPNDQPLIISIGAQPENGNAPITEIADAAEEVMAPYFETKGYRCLQLTQVAKKSLEGVPALFSPGDNVHLDAAGNRFLAELVKMAILSEY